MTEADRQAALQREQLRRERKRERDREMRLKVSFLRNCVDIAAKLRVLAQAAGKKTKAMRDADRDISEKVALGMHVPGKVGLQGEAAFDQRLFNQEQGLSSGFADDEGACGFSTASLNITERCAVQTTAYIPKRCGRTVVNLSIAQRQAKKMRMAQRRSNTTN